MIAEAEEPPNLCSISWRPRKNEAGDVIPPDAEGPRARVAVGVNPGPSPKAQGPGALTSNSRRGESLGPSPNFRCTQALRGLEDASVTQG